MKKRNNHTWLFPFFAFSQCPSVQILSKSSSSLLSEEELSEEELSEEDKPSEVDVSPILLSEKPDELLVFVFVVQPTANNKMIIKSPNIPFFIILSYYVISLSNALLRNARSFSADDHG